MNPIHTQITYLQLESRRPDDAFQGKQGKLHHQACGHCHFLYKTAVAANISAKNEYLLYRKALKENIMTCPELKGVNMKTVLKAREDGLVLLKANIA